MIALRPHLRRHRSQVACLVAVLALAGAAATAHASLMSGSMGDHGGGNLATVCIVRGAAIAVTGAVILAAPRRVLPLMSSSVPAAPRSVRAEPIRSLRSRAGPPALLQVFRF